MGRFNLIEEAWIKVINLNGDNEMVSIRDVFAKASQYQALAGDTRTQDFAVLRILLAILQTVFIRYDLDGNLRELPEDDEDQEDLDSFDQSVIDDWREVWRKESFPNILFEYLEHWRDRFYLFDKEYPFMQVTKKEIDPVKISKPTPSSMAARNFNRLISESANKIALFSPKCDGKDQINKDILTESDLARWLITLQSYIGLSDKVIFGKEKYKASKGWLFDLGGIYFEGKNLFQTLWLNCILLHPDHTYRYQSPKPCWESEPSELIASYLTNLNPDNLATLYTVWSRAVYVDPESQLNEPFSCQIVKLPELEHKDQFLEPMTLWRFNRQGPNKEHFTPIKHVASQSLWRSFGLVALSSQAFDDHHQPGLITWIDQFADLLDRDLITLNSVSMQDDNNATSWVPTDEICDQLNVNAFTLIDLGEGRWVVRINDVVEKTKKVVSVTYKHFLDDLQEIRNQSGNKFSDKQVDALYYQIDGPFKKWLFSLDSQDNKDQRILEWYHVLYRIIKGQADQLVKRAGPRDYTGIVRDKEVKNIATVYNRFIYYLKKELKEEGMSGKEK
ncbi:type I-E CRISPR-associated protein Cse1/CasA [Atopobacter sp. AH10]|uniref:type I-E CRISPR-associated protein Cse1/CasA n=1 Tax=Atopobacter sp. AH10 TaxID=2315861 RepID=UPI000EF1B50C|nr:type I-E CRISPR-associated protein Cse1/CasA [Atopobacter sp. AH10]RLK64294.1 type I-E CRISPR-associated protein Cse1/CasA [Atopobacter sp. AH10]